MTAKKQNGIVRRVAFVVGIIIAIGGVVVSFIESRVDTRYPKDCGAALEIRVEHNSNGLAEIKALVRDEIPQLIEETRAQTAEIKALTREMKESRGGNK